MPALPPTPTSVLALADWLELLALSEADGNASRGDLEEALNAAAILDDDDMEEKLLAVFSELERRESDCQGGYPFAVHPEGVLELRDDAWQTRDSYIFCLCLSYRGNSPAGGTYPARAFEVICREVAAEFLHGEAIRFGSPRTAVEIHRSFSRAVDRVSQLLREGEGYKGVPTSSSKDDGVDIIAWRANTDGRPGKLLAFGACAAGDDWIDKLPRLDPKSWCETWLKAVPASPILRLFFIPHRIDTDFSWDRYTRRGGIIFDRCRLAQYAPSLPPVEPHGDIVNWSHQQIESFSA